MILCIELCICDVFGVFINKEFTDSLLHALQLIVNTCQDADSRCLRDAIQKRLHPCMSQYAHAGYHAVVHAPMQQQIIPFRYCRIELNCNPRQYLKLYVSFCFFSAHVSLERIH